ncbi:MAG: serine dehydratase [Spirochaetes bacterium RBG_13_68_11]|nr:MAG: serine dehydratase [Spirochaetes bacterium RBG_13_68_11]
MTPPDLAAIREAAARIAPHVHRTPVLTCRTFDERFGAHLFFKCENLQRVGAFKFRGAANAVFSLSDAEAARGVATHSSGNHAQALALAARLRGIPAHIVMPDNSPTVKVEAVRGYGGRIVFCEPTQAARERTLAGVVGETGACFVHPYDDPRVIAGQASCTLELLEQAGPLDAILVPIGGGGLASGTLLACGFTSPATSVYAVEPKGADDAFRSVRDGSIRPSTDPRTIADGLRTSLGALTFPIVKALVRKIVTVEEESILSAMRLVWERMKLVIEPSAAVPLAALLEGTVAVQGKRVGIILSGGNVDLGSLPWSR